MIRSNNIVDAVVWLFNLLTFLAAALGFFGLCLLFYKDPQSVKGMGDFIFVSLLFVVSGGIVWKTGQWVFSKPEKIYVPGLLAFWVFLMVIYLMLLGLAMGSMGMGSSQ